MFEKLIRYFRGILHISTDIESFERVLRIAKANNISLNTISNTNEKITFYVYLKDYLKFREVLRKERVFLRIINKTGLPFFINKNKSRWIVVFGLVMSMIIIKYMSLYIWCIDFSGNNHISDESLRKYLKEKRITEGSKISELDATALEEDIRKDFPQIIWVSVDVNGTKLTLSVKENHQLSYNDKCSEVCDLVSDKDGIVVSIVTRRGVSNVKKGDSVKKGDILISGIIQVKSEYDELLRQDYTCADGTVIIQVTYEFKKEIMKSYNEKYYTGRISRAKYLRLPDYTIKLPENVKYGRYDTIIEEKDIKLSENMYTPVKYGKIYYKEYKIKNKQRTKTQAESIVNEAFSEFYENFNRNGIQIIEKNVTIDESEEKYIAQGYVTVTEPVGVRQIINIKEESITNEHN